MKPGMDIFIRVLAAFIGGYALTALVNLVSVLAWPGHRADAVYYGILFPYLVFIVVMIMAFSVRSAWRAWGWIIGSVVVLLGLLALIKVLK